MPTTYCRRIRWGDMSKNEELNIRDALPLSDQDIRNIWIEAQGKKGDLVLQTEPERPTLFALVMLGLMLTVLVVLVTESPNAAVVTLSISMAVVIGIQLVLMHREHRTTEVEYPHVDVNSPEVLKVVVEHFYEEPRKRAEFLKIRIDRDRGRIARSITRLNDIIPRLEEQLIASSDETLKLMIKAKCGSAEDARKQLEVADSELELRWNETVKALKPVEEIVTRFETLWKLTSDITAIREAFALAEYASSESEGYRIEVAYLRALSKKALAHLLDVEASLDATNQARLEVAGLFENRSDVFDTTFPGTNVKQHDPESPDTLETR